MGFISGYNPSYVAREQYAFHKFQNSRSVSALIELGGVVGDRVFVNLGIPVIPIIATSARSKLLGKGNLRQKNQKRQVVDFLKTKGVCFETDDEADAFVVAYKMLCDVSNKRVLI